MSNPVFVSPSEERAEREAKAHRRAVVRSMDDEDFVWVMSQQRGRRFIKRLLSRSRVSDPSFSKNAMLLARFTGIKEFGETELRNRIDRLCPELWQTLLQEKLDD